MTYAQAIEWVNQGYLARREAWPDSTFLSKHGEKIKLCVQDPFSHNGIYSDWRPGDRESDVQMEDWVIRPS